MEPQHSIIEKTEKSIPLKCSAVADYVKYESEMKVVQFNPTMMYTTKVFKFKVRNVSLIEMKFNAKLVNS